VTRILGFPNSSRGGSDINNVGIGNYRIYCGNTPAHTGRADVAGFPVLEFSGVERLGPRSACQQNRQAKREKVVFQVETI
jgi:hypothetical protein